MEKLAEYIIKHLFQALRPDEQKELDAWMAQSDRNKAIFLKFSTWETFSKTASGSWNGDGRDCWDKIRKKVSNLPPFEQTVIHENDPAIGDL